MVHKILPGFEIHPGKWDQKDFNTNFERVSGWIPIREAYDIPKSDPLYDYAEDEYGYHPYNEKFNPENGTFLSYFTYQHRKYAVEQFLGIGGIADIMGRSLGYLENGKPGYISGYDENEIFNPLLAEFDEYCENVRLYKEVR